MDILWQELTFGIAGSRELAVVMIRLVAAIILGAAIGIEREIAGKSAGVRTHILVTLGTAVFVIAVERFGMTTDGLSRVIQGIVTGIGFIGAGTIIKLSEEREVRGLTTSAGIWIAAAIGVTAGLGAVGLAVVGTVFTLLVLTLLVAVDNWINRGELTTAKPSNERQKANRRRDDNPQD
jgi:putative Mg2+ transporter-C (MgtC) family protein